MKLPQCEIFSSPADSGREFLFVAGGRKPNLNWFSKVAAGKKIFCIDKGIEICHALKLLPEYLIGDFDSAEKNSLDWAKEKNIPVERHPVEKDFTDTQLAIFFAERLKENFSCIVTGIFGGRYDHLFSTIFSCARSNRKIFLADEREIIFYIRDGESTEIKFFEKPVAVSLLPITGLCEGVTIKNVRWELDGATLEQNFPNAISNKISGDEIKISVRKGTLAIYFCFRED